MKLLFVHSHPFYKDTNGDIYTGGSFPASIWNNYLLNFEHITMFGRLAKTDASKVSITSGHPNVSFQLTNNYFSHFNAIRNQSLLRKELIPLIEKTDMVLARLPSIAGYLAIIEAKKRNKPVWVEQVGNGRESLKNHGSITGKVASLPLDLLNKHLIKKADFVSYVTLKQLQNSYPASPEALHVALSDVVIEDVLDKNALDKSRFYSNCFRIGLIGGFNTKYKGQDILLEAIAMLPKDIIPNIEVYFAGQGDFHWILNKAKKLGLNNNIKFIGSLQPGKEVNKLLSSLSLYVQPSLTEGMPRATIEAMAMGCPVIGSNVGGLPDIVNNDFLHEKSNIKSLSSHILKLYLDRNLLYSEATDSLIKAEDFHISKLMKKRLSFYNSMNNSLLKNYKIQVNS